jgi:ABC-2 type transport system permease protein
MSATVNAYQQLIRWQLLRNKSLLPVLIVVQALLSLGIVIGYPLLFPEMDETTMLYLATGAPTIALIVMGLVVVPQSVSLAKTEGTYDYMRTLPVARLVYLLADISVWTIVVVPGVVAAVAIAAIRFSLALDPSLLIIPAFLLVGLTATTVGYAIASLLPPTLSQLLSQVLVVFILMFSPLNFPPERLPEWLALIHRFLPIQAMGEVVRGSLAGGTYQAEVTDYLLLVAWCIGGFVVTYLVLQRRG